MGSIRLPSPPPIEAISKLADLEILADQFLIDKGYAPEQVSHWDPKPQFASKVETFLIGKGPSQSLVDYAYSGYIDIEARVRRRLHEQDDRALLLTPSGTTSIANVIAYLSNIGCRKLGVISPYYFAVEAVAAAFGITTIFSGVVRKEGRYYFPNIETEREVSAVWLTFPIYGASSYIPPREIASFIDALPENIVVVVDEGLAFCDRPSLAEVTTIARVIRIITPHKAICANGEKVSFISFPQHLADDLDAWSECFAGGIGAAGVRALQLIGSDQFEKALVGVRSLLAERLSRLLALVRHRSGISMDSNTDGHFVTLYWPSLDMSIGDDSATMRALIYESGCVVVPSSRNKHPPDYGFAFRVNLLRLDDAGLGGLSRFADALDRRL